MKINKTFNLLLVFTEFSMFISVFIFCFFIIQGYMTLGHLPYYGDKQTISSNGFDRLIVAIMIYPMCFGFYVWGILTSSGILLGLKRRRKLYIIGFTLCVLNILAMLSSQFEWILD